MRERERGGRREGGQRERGVMRGKREVGWSDAHMYMYT